MMLLAMCSWREKIAESSVINRQILILAHRAWNAGAHQDAAAILGGDESIARMIGNLSEQDIHELSRGYFMFRVCLDPHGLWLAGQRRNTEHADSEWIRELREIHLQYLLLLTNRVLNKSGRPDCWLEYGLSKEQADALARLDLEERRNVSRNAIKLLKLRLSRQDLGDAISLLHGRRKRGGITLRLLSGILSSAPLGEAA